MDDEKAEKSAAQEPQGPASIRNALGRSQCPGATGWGGWSKTYS